MPTEGRTLPLDATRAPDLEEDHARAQASDARPVHRAHQDILVVVNLLLSRRVEQRRRQLVEAREHGREGAGCGNVEAVGASSQAKAVVDVRGEDGVGVARSAGGTHFLDGDVEGLHKAIRHKKKRLDQGGAGGHASQNRQGSADVQAPYARCANTTSERYDGGSKRPQTCHKQSVRREQGRRERATTN
eukprot:848950-Prymnesium_polylepis.2